MSHDPHTKKCRGCGRAIGAGAYCLNCRHARRKKGIGRRRSGGGSKRVSAWMVLGSSSWGATGLAPQDPAPRVEATAAQSEVGDDVAG